MARMRSAPPTSDNQTQTGLRRTGSRLLNLIMGNSSDSLPQTPKAKEGQLLVPHFVVRQPSNRRSSRTVSLAEGLDHRSDFAAEERKSLLREDAALRAAEAESVVVDLAPTDDAGSRPVEPDKKAEQEAEPSPYEPNSSTESLVPDSQCSGDSYTQLISK